MSGTETEVRVAGALPPVSVGVTAVAVVVVAVLVAPSPVPLGVALTGGVGVAIGLFRFESRSITAGAGLLFVAVVLSGGRSTGWYLAATVPVVLAWVNARYALRLGRQIGRAGATLRVELVHTILTLAVLVVGGGAGYVASRSVTGGGSPLSLALLFVAVVLFTVALRRA